jgi:radical SAM superfamily enzyme YgiQ (UPF0313 family)
MKFGLESVDPAVLKRIGKPIKLDRVELVVNTARRLGIKTHMTVTLGLSGETRESIEKTFDFACRIDVDSVQFSVATPYPGTRFYDELKEGGFLRYQSWEDFDGANNAVFEVEGVDAGFVEEFEATAHGRWLRHKLRNPRWALRQARYLARLFRGQGMAGLQLRVSRGLRLLFQRGPSRKPSSGAPAVSGLRQHVAGPRP